MGGFRDLSRGLTKWALIFFIITILGNTARATTVVMLSDEDLIVSSRAIVRGKVTSIESRFDDSHTRIYTYITIQVKSVLKGNINTEEIVIRQLGGRVGDFTQVIYGAPEYRVGERVLLYLETADDGALRIAQFLMGKFTIQTDPVTGRQYVQRLFKDVRTIEQQVDREITNEMGLKAYQKKIRRILAERADRVAEFEQKNAGRPMLAVPGEFTNRRTGGSIQPQFTFLGSGFRWFEADTGTPIIYRLNTANAPIGGGGQTEFISTLAAWTNVSSASIILQAGTSTSSCGFASDGITSVSFGDCRNEISDPVNCSGVLAIGGVSSASSETKVVNGKSFNRIIEGDVVFNNFFECFLGVSSNLAEVMTHEIGHSLGLGHSSENAGESNAALKDATMFFRAHGDGRGASVRSDDIAGLSFIYPVLDPISINGFSPTSGPSGTHVTITGNNLGNPSSVKFGVVPATVLSSSDTDIVAVVPPTAVTGKITVTGAGGTATSTGTFTVIKPPASITFSTTPFVGGAPVGATVTISGTNVGSATDVKFNGTSVTSSITVVSTTSIKVVVPAGATTGKVSVENLAGSGQSTADFKILPAINSFAPLSGISGGSVTINGTSFSNLASVKFGSVVATVTSFSDSQIVVTVPATAITGKISVTTTSGTVISAGTFTVIKPPANITFSTTPFVGGAPVGATITVSGTNVGTASDVKFNGVSITSPITVVSATSVKVVVPASCTTGKITVENLAGSAQSVADFKILPGISSFAPLSGISGGSVTINGTSFSNLTSVKFGSVAAAITSSSDNQIVVTVPATAITGKISVTTTSGTVISAGTFTVIKPPANITFSTTPFVGGAPIGATVTISGANVGSASNVKFNGTSVTSLITVVTATSIKVVVPAGATTGKVRVENLAGFAMSAADFKILPGITGLSANNGIAGDSITISGTSLSNPLSVKFGSIVATITSSTDTEIVTVVPATAATGRISVTTANGTVLSANNFTVIKAPTISSISPALTTGAPVGANVTISGANIGFVFDVRFNDTPLTAPITVLSPTQIRVVVPAGATTGKIRVENRAGVALSSADFKVLP